MDFPSVIELSDIPESREPAKTRNQSKGIGNPHFGGGIELLMNDKVKTGSSSGASSMDFTDVDDLSKLEFELNELSNGSNHNTSDHISFNDKPSSMKTTSFDIPSGSKENTHTININTTLGDDTADTGNEETTTWDGYSKLNTTINPDKVYVNPEAHLSKEELLREKFKILKKIETLERKGVEFTTKYNMDSSLSEMTSEYDTVMDERSKQNSIRFQGNMMISLVNGIEYLNGKLDYLDIKLDGWSEQVNDNINDYDDIFGELYDQYKDKTAISPWVKLMFQLGGSAFMVHLTNTMFKSAMPSMDDIFRQNPDLMKSFQSAAVNTMGKTAPGFSGFMGGLASGGLGGGSSRPLSTQPLGESSKMDYEEYISQTRGGNNSYGSHTTSTFRPPPSQPPARSSVNQYPSGSGARPEMKGPNDINDILSRIKPKATTRTSIPSSSDTNVEYYSSSSAPTRTVSTPFTNDNSTISLSELSELNADQHLPKRSKRRPKSDKNTISLSL